MAKEAGPLPYGVGSNNLKKERAASCAICFANDFQLSREKQRREYTAGALLERVSAIASRMATGIHPMTSGILAHLTDDYEPSLDLVINDVTIPALAEPVRAPEEEPDRGQPLF